jgi:hypothetical protein
VFRRELVLEFSAPAIAAWTRQERTRDGHMASSGKKKTTMAKLTRESRLRERRLDKKAKKDARKLAPVPGDALAEIADESLRASEEPSLEPVVQRVADAGSRLAG